jgi:predicted DNA-binding protein
MSSPDIAGASSKERGVKTLAIRLEPELHAQLSLIAQLRGSTITDEIRTALTTHIASAKAQPELAARAGNVLESIERDALARRDAIANLFGSSPTTEATTSATASRSRSRKTGPATGDEETPGV